jgi:hypothetical protein
MCGDLSYLDGSRRASGYAPVFAVSDLGVRPAWIGGQGVKEVEEGGGDGFEHVGWLFGEVHVDVPEVVHTLRVLIGRRLGHALLSIGARELVGC